MLRLPSSSATASWPNRKFSLFISPFVLHQSAFASGFLFRSLYGFSFIVRKTSLSLYLLHSFSKTLLDLCLSIQLKCFFPSSAAFRRLFLGWRLWSEVLETLWWLRIPELTSAGWDVTFFFTFFLPSIIIIQTCFLSWSSFSVSVFVLTFPLTLLKGWEYRFFMGQIMRWKQVISLEN